MRPRRVWYLLLWWAAALAACPEEEVGVVLAHDRPPYVETAAALIQALEAHGIPGRSYDPAALTSDTVCPRLWAALGSRAVARIRDADPSTPLVATLILDRQLLRRVRPATGIALPHPVERIWQWLRRLFPKVRHVALLHDGTDPPRAQAIERLARQAHLGFTAVTLHSDEAVLTALESLPDDVEALWIDGHGPVFTPAAARAILVAAYRRRIPAIGLSRRWVEAGAAFALDWDYRDLGRQTAALIAGLWSRPDAGLPPPPPPHRAVLVVNQQIFHHLGRPLPQDLPQDTVLLP